MEKEYSIEEILSAVDEIQNSNKKNKLFSSSNKKKIDNTEIPINTLKLIEEAEKFNF